MTTTSAITTNLDGHGSGRVEVTIPTGERRERLVKLDLENGRPVLLEIIDVLFCKKPGKLSTETATYWCDPLQADFGRGYRLRKMTAHQTGDGDDQYSVLLDGEKTSCECKGFLRHGHCKHVESLVALALAGHLEGGRSC